MQRYVLIPAGLDVFQLIEDNPPGFSGFRLEKLVRVINLIYKQRYYTRWEIYNGYVQIINHKFSELADDYLQYVNYLIRSDVLLCDKIARPAKEFPENPKSYGYRFSAGVAIEFDFFDVYTLPKAHRMRSHSVSPLNREKYEKWRSEFPFIKFLDNLDVDFASAHACIKDLQNQIVASSTLTPAEKDAAIWKLSIHAERLNAFSWCPSRQALIDEKGRRLHTPLTRLKKELRFFVTYKGEQLFGVDLKNCQPLLSLALLNPEFWVEPIIATADSRTKKGKEILAHPLGARVFTDLQRIKGRLKTYLNVGDIHPELAGQLWELSPSDPHSPQPLYEMTDVEQGRSTLASGGERKNTSQIISIMMGLTSEYLDKQEVVKYQDHVASGQIYEVLLSHIKDALVKDCSLVHLLNESGLFWTDDISVQRKTAKGLLLRALFAPNRTKNEVIRFAIFIFSKSYPTISSFFRRIKVYEYQVFSHLLQRIESFIVLKACAQKIEPRIPIWTIHDNIVTTEKHIPKIKEVIQQVIERYIGVTPSVTVESWADYIPWQGLEDDTDHDFDPLFES